MQYVLKVCGTTVILTPFLFLALLYALPNYQISDLISLMFLIYILPYTLSFNIFLALVFFFIIFKTYPFTKMWVIKLILSVLSVIVIFGLFKSLYLFDPANIFVNDYLLACTISTVLVILLWFYKFEPGIVPIKEQIDAIEI